MILTDRDLKRLEGVDERLVRVVKRAAEITGQPFFVLEGVRSREACKVNYGKGRTAAQLQAKGIEARYAQPGAAKVTWLNNPFASKHCEGEAVDLAPLPLDWNNLKAFDAIALAMMQAAEDCGVHIRWGADWDADGRPREKGESDSPHFEL